MPDRASDRSFGKRLCCALISPANEQAIAIRMTADSRALNILSQAYKKNMDFYQVLQTYNIFAKSLTKEQNRIILSTDTPVLSWLSKGIAPVQALPLAQTLPLPLEGTKGK